ncbi:MAG: 4-hydroxybenzoate polyprenyltransferase [Epsilonproteobacteria bacterium]|nr:4-hydroxybenzoate polyprenyltransferase [Campylobacterota bacterium]
MNKFLKILKDINELIMFKHSIFALPFIFISMIVAAKGWFGVRLLFLGVAAAVTARNFAMAFNRYADRDIDIKNERTKNRPSVDGRVKEKHLIYFIVINAVLFVWVAYLINDLAFYLSVPILIVLAAYSYFKRFSETAHLVLGLSLGLAPIAGVVAVREEITLWSVFLSIGVMFWVAGFDLLYSLQDMEFDKKEGLYSIPAIYGAKCTLFISKIFHALTILFWFFFIYLSGGGTFLYIALLISAIILYKEHKIVEKDFRQIDRAFFTLNGYLGIMFLFFTILDVAVR